MTATEIVEGLWRKVFGTNDIAIGPDIESTLKSCWTKLFHPAWDRWADRNDIICVRHYNRDRDNARALRHNDLRLAADLDRIAAKKK